MTNIPNEEAREYFKPLTYEDITQENFYLLISILQKHIEIRNKIELENYEKHDVRDYIYSIPLNKIIYRPQTNRRPFEAFIKVLCDNYSLREAISFNSDGFIGFAGWASSYNTILFTDAFKEWVDVVKRKKPGNNSLLDINPPVDNIINEITNQRDLLQKKVDIIEQLCKNDNKEYAHDIDNLKHEILQIIERK